MNDVLKKLLIPIVLCLTLGLAPFLPEPHIVAKIRWILGGANGMAAADWFDVALHGTPWIWLVVALIHSLSTRGTMHFTK